MTDQEQPPTGIGPGSDGDSEAGGDVRDPLIGERLGPYRIESLLGAGGMGAVYLGVDEALERKAAVKVLSLLSPRWMARFIAEARNQARLDHPNIVPVYGAGSAMVRGLEVHFIALKYIEGKSLAELVREQGPLDPVEATELILDAARGLYYVHTEGFLHRDVKPSNILVDLGGRALISDFGVSRGRSTRAGEPLTGSDFAGTWIYASPEQIARRALDERSDVYSLGATYLYALTGLETEDTGPSGPDPTRRLEGIDPALAPLVRHALEEMLGVAPGDRFPSMLACVEALEQTLAVLTSERATGTGDTATGFRAGSRRLAPVLRAGAFLLAVAAIVSFLVFAATREDQAKGPRPRDRGPGIKAHPAAPRSDDRSTGSAEQDTAPVPEDIESPAPAAVVAERPVEPSGPSALALQVSELHEEFVAEAAAIELQAAAGSDSTELLRRVEELVQERIGALDRQAYEAGDSAAAAVLDGLVNEVVPHLAAVLDDLTVGPVDHAGAQLGIDLQPVTILQYFSWLLHVSHTGSRRNLAPLMVSVELTPTIWVEFQSPRRIRRPRFDHMLDPLLAPSALAIEEFAGYCDKRVPTKEEWELVVAPLLAAGDLRAEPAILERVDWDGEPYFAGLLGQERIFRWLLKVRPDQRGLRLVRTLE